MTDVTFPAHVVLTEEVSIDGLPMLTATVSLGIAALELELPDGPDGDQGPPGEPQPPFLKMGTLANVGARPGGLTATDRGKWWHRLDNGSMDFWDGSGWRNLANAVGATGPVAPANTLTALDVISDETVTTAGLDIKPITSSEQTIQLTVPAGARGATGAPGASGTILTSPDYDSTQGPVGRSMFTYSRISRRFRPTPPPCGYGPWHWAAADFAADASGAVEAYDVLTAVMPVLPYAWRPMCHGGIQTYADTGSFAHVYVRLYNSTGVATAIGSNFWQTFWELTEFGEHYGNPNSVGMSPSSEYAVVPANYPSQLLVRVERQGSTSGTIGYKQALAALTVYAMPVHL